MTTKEAPDVTSEKKTISAKKLANRANVKFGRLGDLDMNLYPYNPFQNGLVLPYANHLKIRLPNIRLDNLAHKALKDVANSERHQNGLQAAKDFIRENALTASIAEVTAKLNKAGLDSTTRLLLSEEAIYGFLLLYALHPDYEKIDGKDVEGVYNSILRNLNEPVLNLLPEPEGSGPNDTSATTSSTIETDNEGPKAQFYITLVDKVLEKNSILLELALLEQLYIRTFHRGVSLSPGQVKNDIMQLLKEVRLDGELPYYVNKFVTERGEISLNGQTGNILDEMVKYLRRLNINIVGEDEFNNGNYDEYFALAYDYALKQMSGGEDPLKNVYGSGAFNDWNFEVDTFETHEEQGIIKDNIRAAGAVYYNFILGEQMGVYKIADALILRWAGGALDIPNGDTATNLYRYYKLRENRYTSEERDMLNKRILDIGDSKLLDSMVVNKNFPLLWDKLLREVAEYIRKFEESNGEDDQVSKSPIYQATRELQYNLSSNMTGMAHLQATENYIHLKDALEILSAPEVVDALAGGQRKNKWTVIEKIAKEDFKTSLNISPLKTAAVEGNKIFQWLADFDQSSVTDDQFREFLNSAEAYIIAQADEQSTVEDFEEDKIDEFEEDEEEFDDFEDF